MKEHSDAQLEPVSPGLNGWPLLTDFGSAQSFATMNAGQIPLNVNDQIQTHGWTRAYAAPEVQACRGEWQTVRSDMFSWAKTIKAISSSQQLPTGLQELCEAGDLSLQPLNLHVPLWGSTLSRCPGRSSMFAKKIT